MDDDETAPMTVTPANALSVTEVLTVAPLFRNGVTTALFDGSAVYIGRESAATLDVEPGGWMGANAAT